MKKRRKREEIDKVSDNKGLQLYWKKKPNMMTKKFLLLLRLNSKDIFCKMLIETVKVTECHYSHGMTLPSGSTNGKSVRANYYVLSLLSRIKCMKFVSIEFWQQRVIRTQEIAQAH